MSEFVRVDEPIFMAKTKGGETAKEWVEVLWWIGVAVVLLLCLLVPIGIGLASRLWAWALS